MPKPTGCNPWAFLRPAPPSHSRLSALLLPPAHPPARTGGDALRRNPAADARRGPLAGADAARPALPRQTAAVLLAGDGQLPPLRRPRLGGPTGAGAGRRADRADRLRLGPAGARAA